MQTFFCNEDYAAYIDLMASGVRAGPLKYGHIA
ncbi:hypothetical protein BROSI_A2297 [Candidatus Brocadia sinica JPN1]|uniref:Uncharacterized protein n=1 Tax=Candidatus Brocadia sinica JPN1 TaxID=1197129 RepID=A0ABQ0JYP1_9BACT|nr:hypothetical protein BROSI_A2297 [Candidatus Brocadia sinica JPN1]